MRVNQSGKHGNPSQNAVNQVNKNRKKTPRIPHNSTQNQSAVKKLHSILNMYTGKKMELDTDDLVKLAHEYINWIGERKFPTPFYKFWKLKGFIPEDIKYIAASEPAFAQLIEFGRLFVADTWNDPLTGEAEMKGDRETIRKRAPIYVKEWQDYDHDEKEFEYKLRKALEETNTLTEEQIVRIQQICFGRIEKPKGWKERDGREGQVNAIGAGPDSKETI